MGGETRHFGELFAESTRNGLTRPKAVRGSGVKMVNMGELFAHPRLVDAPMDRVPLSDVEAEKFLLVEGDLLFARQSLVLEGAGKCSIFLHDTEPVTFESHVTRVRLDPQKGDPRFYFYYLQSHHGGAAIRSIVEQGAGASGIRGSDLQTLDVLWLPIGEQRAIAHILGTLDDKIELNRRMNETLEAMARALFKSWFVDFDPVRAKAEGRDTGLPKEIADLFPARFVESELGEVPEGWRAGSIYEIADVVYGAPFSSSQFNNEKCGEPLIRIRDLPNESPGVWTPEVHPKGYKVRAGDIVVGMDGEFRAYLWGGDEAWLNQRVCVFVPKNDYSAAFVRNSIIEPLAQVEATETATTVIHLGKSDIDRFVVVAPTESVLATFNQYCQPWYDRIISSKRNSRTLSALRDSLLPKLISGELRVKDAEKFVEARA